MAVTKELVEAAYQALATGDRAEVAKYWAEDMRWLVPGNHQLAGWWEGLDGFFGFMEQVGKLSGGSFVMTRSAILLADEWSADVSHNVGARVTAKDGSTSPYDRLEIDVVHLLRWRDDKVIEGRGAIFGDGTTQFNQFWSQLATDATRVGA
ncbi:nuclear transport factor 2 family protein [Micromonospora sp. NPDC006766]|uniref:nuclear transport factor 2 family protein n=1 Tax=Micromonospora sp. NPDC006766 TaxID=3154778 RepID=UPI0033D11A9C